MTGPPPGERHHTRGDGDGWVECSLGHRHWGLFGAAGLLLHRPGAGGAEVLLQHRATWSHHGGTWGLLGGARHSTETAVQAALREAAEEGAVDGSQVRVHARYDDSHGGWSYATVLGSTPGDAEARPASGESIDVAWFPVDEVEALPLHPGFAATWPAVRAGLSPLTVVVDAANVMGSRPDGWWRDRAAAARRLVAELAPLAAQGLSDDELPDGLDRPDLSHWWPRVVVVVEGAARPAVEPSPGDHIDVVAAAGSGDDAIVEVLTASGPGPLLVVTADRELRARAEAVGATPAGPRWLFGTLAG